MTRRWSVYATLGALLLAGLPALAQWQAPQQPAPQYGNNYIPEGTRFIIRMKDKIEAKKAEQGKKFKAELAEDLVAPNGDVIPRGKKIKGHVSSNQDSRHLLLSFDQIETRHGWMPLVATIVGVPGDKGMKVNDNNEGEIQRKGPSKKRVIETAAIGAGAGAATGAAVGGAHGAIIGAGIGAAAGGVTGVLRGTDLKLDKDTQLEVQLDRPLEVPRS